MTVKRDVEIAFGQLFLVIFLFQCRVVLTFEVMDINFPSNLLFIYSDKNFLSFCNAICYAVQYCYIIRFCF